MTLTTEQVAEILHTTPTTVRRMASAGRLTASKVGRRWLFTQESVDALLAEHSNRESRPTRRRRRRAA